MKSGRMVECGSFRRTKNPWVLLKGGDDYVGLLQDDEHAHYPAFMFFLVLKAMWFCPIQVLHLFAT